MTTEQAIKELKFAEIENQMRKNSAELEKMTCPFCGRPVGVSNGALSTYGITRRYTATSAVGRYGGFLFKCQKRTTKKGGNTDEMPNIKSKE